VAEKISRLQNELNGMTQTGEAETAFNGCSRLAPVLGGPKVG